MLKKNCLIAICLPSLAGGGAERAMLAIAKGFIDLGYRVDVVVTNSSGKLLHEVAEGIRLINLNVSKVSYSLFKLISYIKSEKPQVIYSTPNHMNILVIIAKVLSGTDTSVVVREANVPISSLKRHPLFSAKIVCKLIPYTYKLARRIIAVSQDVKAELIVLSPKLGKKITVIGNPVVSSEFLLRAEEAINHPWFVQSDIPIVIGMGRLHPQKDFSTLIRAFSIARKQQEMRLVILGEGSERDALSALIKELGIEKDAQLVGFVTNPFPYLKRSRVFVLSSLYEGMPNVLIQAMSLNIPVVTTNCPGGILEVLDNGKYGIKVPVGDAAEMAEAIIQSIALPKQYEAGNYVRNKFSLERIVQEYLNVLS